MVSPSRMHRRHMALVLLMAFVFSTASPALAQTLSPAGRVRVAVAPIRVAAHLDRIPTIVQTLNNCGPASIAAVLRYWGIVRTQQQVQSVVRGDGSPRGMAPFGVPGYMRSLGMRGMLGVAGSPRLLKALISNGFPVIVSQWVSATDHIRHYRPIVAYDDRSGIFRSSDPYLGAGHPITYAEFAGIWAVSDQRFIVLYPPSRQTRLDAVLAAAGWNRTKAYRHDLAWERNRMRHMPAGVDGYLARYYGYPSLAWDQMELGQVVAARQTLGTASAKGASSVVTGWVKAELAWRTSHPRR